MGKAKRKHPDIEEILARPWCYYCERDFDDLKILINHQKAKHFKCERCGRRLNTAGGLSVHMTQVHKETLTIIENALPNRSGLDVEIFGMEGIPDDVVQAHQQRVLQSFAQAEAERRAATGNVGPGGVGASGAKKPKFESPADLKKRLADHKAKKAAEEAAGISSGENTPGGIGHGGQSPGTYAGSPGFSQPQMSYASTPITPGYSSLPQSYAQSQPPSFQPQQSPFPPQQSPFSPPGPPPFQNGQGFPPQQQFQPPPGQGFQPPQFQNSPPNFQGGPPPGFQGGPPPPFQGGPPQQFQNGPPQQFQNGPPQQFQGGPPPQFQNGSQQYQNGPPQFQNTPPPQFQNGPPFQGQNGPPPQFQNGAQFQNAPPRSFGAGSPAPPFQQNQFQPPRTHTPPQHNGMPQRPPVSLPPAPGLPQRPSFAAPPVNAFQMQQMHQGQMAGLPNPIDTSPNGQQVAQSGVPQSPGPGPAPGSKVEPSAALSATASSLDDLVSGAAKDADKAAATTAESKAEVPEAKETQEGKKGKKEKDKNMKLVYSDNEVSPEEKMARMPRYAFAPSG